jgi:hypothetical protein
MSDAPNLTPPTVHQPAQHHSGFLGRVSQSFVRNFAAEAFAAWILALLSGTWVYLGRNPGVPRWFLVVVVVTVLFAYFSLFFVHHVFEEFRLSHRLRVHIVLLGLLVVTVTVPVALLQSLTRARLHQSDVLHAAEATELRSTIARLEATQESDARDRLLLYAKVTESLQVILAKSSIDVGDFHDLFNRCMTSIYLANPSATKAADLRAAVFYLDKTRQHLVIPPDGYDGYGLGRDIRNLHFLIAPPAPGETRDAYCQRLGVAGWSFVNGQIVRSPDVQNVAANEGYCYKPAGGAQHERPDRAMICVPIPDFQAGPDHFIGVLSVSSLTPGLFTDRDAAVVRFFAALFGKFHASLEPPPTAVASN